MSVIPSELTAHHGSTVSILGHKVSTDALLIAGASLVGILVLWRMAKPSGSASVGSSVDQVG
ncbi:MAG TPA: hypothetical protein VGU27_12740, partial [Candidatus Eisenbacteria bacterium]|nr:hypothetical protein [Candidatus Eisenbacteria bacterium]